MSATPEILSMSPTRIEEETIKEPNLPLSLDSGEATNIHFERGGPINRRSQNSKIWIAEFNNESNRLLLIGALQQQAHTSQTYVRATSHVRPDQSTARHTRITIVDNSIHTVDISNGYLHLPARAEQQRRATYSPYFCHKHSHQGSHNAH